MGKIKFFIKRFRYFVESLIVRFGLFFFQALGLKKSSNLASSLARFIGKKISVNSLARKNIAQSLPNLSNAEIDGVIDDMWDNLGRIVGEFPHISNLSGKELGNFVSLDEESAKNIEYIKKNFNGGIIFSAHIGNWEIGPKIFLENGMNVKTVYRPLNNPLVEDMTAKMRKVELISKSSKGSKQIINEIKDGNYVIILADQRTSDGILVPFFNRPALTTASIAKLALKYNVPLIPARSIRIGREFKFLVKVEKPIEFQKTDNINGDFVAHLTTIVNQKLEEWIKQYPSQWFWVHDRWKK
ncbi:MAG: lipid biosynthesis lauroyl acyltransferase [Rickettsiaceae bacterium]|jgi:KDO2-lipid IV(A) lauroyltransferase|nr:lipid biosynthesis lauroyl acyltransferase [Rickettsiaceae bacterium]